MNKIKVDKDDKNIIRINRILDLISSFGFEVERDIISSSDYKNINEYIKENQKYDYLYNKTENREDAQIFHIKEIKNWVFVIELLSPTKPYDPEAIVWGMWIPGIDKFTSTRTPYFVKLVIDPYGKENNRFWDNDKLLKNMFRHIIKYKWVSRYYSYMEYFDFYDYKTPFECKIHIYKKYLKDILNDIKKWLIIKYIYNISIPIQEIMENIICQSKEYTNNSIILDIKKITDKYRNKLETLTYRNDIDLVIRQGDIDDNNDT